MSKTITPYILGIVGFVIVASIAQNIIDSSARWDKIEQEQLYNKTYQHTIKGTTQDNVDIVMDIYVRGVLPGDRKAKLERAAREIIGSQRSDIRPMMFNMNVESYLRDRGFVIQYAWRVTSRVECGKDGCFEVEVE